MACSSLIEYSMAQGVLSTRWLSSRRPRPSRAASQWNSLAMSYPAVPVTVFLPWLDDMRRTSFRLSSPYQAMVRRA